MATKKPIEIEGFKELNQKLKKLPDKVKRTEVLKIFRRLARPVIRAYASKLPVGKKDKERFGKIYPKGTLAKSVKAETVPARKSGGNPSIAVRPGKKGIYDSWYKFMVVRKGFKGSGPGSRKGQNTVVEEARDKAASAVLPSARAKAEKQTAKYIQKRINQFSE